MLMPGIGIPQEPALRLPLTGVKVPVGEVSVMEQYAGIDVSLELSSVCIVDAQGKIVKEAKVASEPEALVGFFETLGFAVDRPGGRTIVAVAAWRRR